MVNSEAGQTTMPSTPSAAELVSSAFRRDILPALTPLILDPSHPFPPLREGAFYIAVRLQGRRCDRAQHGLVLVPPGLPRAVTIMQGPVQDVVAVEHLVARHLPQLFPGRTVEAFWVVRVGPLHVEPHSDKSVSEAA